MSITSIIPDLYAREIIRHANSQGKQTTPKAILIITLNDPGFQRTRARYPHHDLSPLAVATAAKRQWRVQCVA